MANKYLVYEREKQKLLKQQEQGKKIDYLKAVKALAKKLKI